MVDEFELIKREIQEKNILIDKLDKCKVQDKNRIHQLKIELDRLLYTYYRYLTKGNGLKAFL